MKDLLDEAGEQPTGKDQKLQSDVFFEFHEGVINNYEKFRKTAGEADEAYRNFLKDRKQKARKVLEDIMAKTGRKPKDDLVYEPNEGMYAAARDLQDAMDAISDESYIKSLPLAEDIKEQMMIEVGKIPNAPERIAFMEDFMKKRGFDYTQKMALHNSVIRSKRKMADYKALTDYMNDPNKITGKHQMVNEFQSDLKRQTLAPISKIEDKENLAYYFGDKDEIIQDNIVTNRTSDFIHYKLENQFKHFLPLKMDEEDGLELFADVEKPQIVSTRFLLDYVQTRYRIDPSTAKELDSYIPPSTDPEKARDATSRGISTAIVKVKNNARGTMKDIEEGIESAQKAGDTYAEALERINLTPASKDKLFEKYEKILKSFKMMLVLLQHTFVTRKQMQRTWKKEQLIS